ncbi:MAG: Nif3-like dinuclear metal center hexameric protein [Bacteroidota bacterium]
MKNHSTPRRKFLKKSATSLATVSLATSPLAACATNKKALTSPIAKDWTIQEVMDVIIAQIPGGKKETTVDTIKIGNAANKVTGIVSTFMATVEVIERAAWLGANFIITHEPTFYNHLDHTTWLKDDPVYQHKKALLEKHSITVWRFHDYWHTYRPDGILKGFLQEVGWESYLDVSRENTCVIPEISLKSLAQFLKKQFQLTRTFYIGDGEMLCQNVGILPGAWGGGAHIPFLGKENIEVLIVGESAEWEAVEYVRDAARAGLKKGLIILGHARSEEPGMRWLVDWLRPQIAGVQITYVAAGDPLIPVM